MCICLWFVAFWTGDGVVSDGRRWCSSSSFVFIQYAESLYSILISLCCCLFEPFSCFSRWLFYTTFTIVIISTYITLCLSITYILHIKKNIKLKKKYKIKNLFFSTMNSDCTLEYLVPTTLVYLLFTYHLSTVSQIHQSKNKYIKNELHLTPPLSLQVPKWGSIILDSDFI